MGTGEHNSVCTAYMVEAALGLPWLSPWLSLELVDESIVQLPDLPKSRP